MSTKLALNYLLSLVLFIVICTQGVIIHRNQHDIKLLKIKDAQIMDGVTRVFEIDAHVFEQNVAFATEINACNLFISSRGLMFIYRTTHSKEDIEYNGHAKT